MRADRSLFGGFAEPMKRFDVVLVDDVAPVMAYAQEVLRVNVPPFGALANPCDRLGVILQIADFQLVVVNTQVDDRVGMPPVRSLAKPFDRFFEISFDAQSFPMEFAHSVLRFDVPPLRVLPDLFELLPGLEGRNFKFVFDDLFVPLVVGFDSENQRLPLYDEIVFVDRLGRQFFQTGRRVGSRFVDVGEPIVRFVGIPVFAGRPGRRFFRTGRRAGSRFVDVGEPIVRFVGIPVFTGRLGRGFFRTGRRAGSRFVDVGEPIVRFFGNLIFISSEAGRRRRGGEDDQKEGQ